MENMFAESFQKKFKKVLDKPKDMWYNVKVAANNSSGHRKASKKFFWKNFKKRLDKLKKMWYNK